MPAEDIYARTGFVRICLEGQTENGLLEVAVTSDDIILTLDIFSFYPLFFLQVIVAPSCGLCSFFRHRCFSPNI